ncbi:tRNA lysidine(34) synthetase TilS [Mycoplasma sp. P36-A1]|uniref:tRNA lysidine(34) synthetase TilS n=1 Tax=Mycoplasma sp. P36-A1 TaxID=3252900 RepID=UPI003C30006F
MKKIIIALSGGIDSMVLLDIMYKKDFEIVAAHVNYQKRIDSYIDLEVIKEYIKNKNIILETKTVKKEEYTHENFQAQARDIRYDFFMEVAKKYDTNILYVAHHKDDYLETYLFQKNRGGIYSYYGIASITQHKSLLVIRPLLDWYKSDINNYSKINNVPFHQDSSNLTLDYTRNVNRHELSKLTVAEKNIIHQEVLEKNERLFKEIRFLQKNNKPFYKVSEFKKWNQNIKRRWLYSIMKNYSVTTKNLDEIIRQIETASALQKTFLDTTVIVSYGIIYTLYPNVKKYKFEVTNDTDYIKIKQYFKDNFNFNLKQITTDYPYIIRAITDKELSNMGKNTKKHLQKIKKRKIAKFLQDSLPVVVKNDTVIDWAFNY